MVVYIKAIGNPGKHLDMVSKFDRMGVYDMTVNGRMISQFAVLTTISKTTTTTIKPMIVIIQTTSRM
jgi:hypothetical protein